MAARGAAAAAAARPRAGYCCLPNILQMEAVVVTRHGGPEVLEMQCLPVPQPEPDEILIGMLLDVHLCHAAITCARWHALLRCRTAALPQRIYANMLRCAFEYKVSSHTLAS